LRCPAIAVYRIVVICLHEQILQFKIQVMEVTEILQRVYRNEVCLVRSSIGKVPPGYLANQGWVCVGTGTEDVLIPLPNFATLLCSVIPMSTLHIIVSRGQS
jgi:hypothetical protein